jgi:hypothetical protein
MLTRVMAMLMAATQRRAHAPPDLNAQLAVRAGLPVHHPEQVQKNDDAERNAK